MKAAFQESSEAVQCTLTAAFLAKAEFQQLTSSHTRYPQLDTWGNLLYTGFFSNHISLLLRASQSPNSHLQPGAWAEDFLLHLDLGDLPALGNTEKKVAW